MTIDLSSTLFENFCMTAREHADRPALTFLDANLIPATYTYARLFERVDILANTLAELNLSPAAPLGILLESQEAQTLHYLAALKCGLIPAILTPPNRKLDRQYYLETTRAVFAYCGFSAVITEIEDFADVCQCLAPFELRHVAAAVDGSGEKTEARTTGPSEFSRNQPVVDAALLQFSSGTTGTKRGVLLSHRAVLEQLQAYSSSIAFCTDDCVVSWLPLYHDMGFMTSLNMPLACGVHSVMLEPIDWVANPGSYLRAVSRHRGTLSWHPNFAFSFMAQRVRDNDLAGVDLSSLRGLVNCSEPVTKESQDRFTTRFSDNGLREDVFWGCYAMAETAFALTHGRSGDAGYISERQPANAWLQDKSPQSVSVGRALPGVELIVADEQGRPLAAGEMGELRARSPFNLEGYFNNQTATDAAIIDGWYCTGDLGFREGKEFYICGRKKDLLIVGGVNVHPQDVEEMVSAMPDILPGRVAVFSDFDSVAQTERIVLLAESSVSSKEQLPLVLEIRQRILASFQIANFDVQLVAPGWLIKSSSGKMARSANRTKWRAAA